MVNGHQSPFGQQLKHWRKVRKLSQLDLALDADVSARHICFVETGRSRPGRDMVLRLAETLDLPLRDRNALLTAAGFGPAFAEHNLSAGEMAPLRRALDHLLRSHEPFPAMVIDRLWNVVLANETATSMFPGMDGTPGAAPPNAIETLLGPGPYRTMVENWGEIANHALGRLRLEVAHSGGDPELSALLERAVALIGDALVAEAEPEVYPAIVSTRIRMGDVVLSTFATVARFGTAQEITANELRVEHIFPADDVTEAFFRNRPRAAA